MEIQKEDLIVKLDPDDLRGLEDKDMLCMNLLDIILHCWILFYIQLVCTTMMHTISTTVLVEQ